MPFKGPVADRLAIRELYGAYCDATMSQDRALYLSLWSENGVRIASDGELHGKAEIARHWDGVWSFMQGMGFFVEVGSIEIDGDFASTRVFCRETVQLKDGAILRIIGRYDDVLAKQDGRWLLQRREYQVIMREADGI